MGTDEDKSAAIVPRSYYTREIELRQEESGKNFEEQRPHPCKNRKDAAPGRFGLERYQ